VVGTFLIGSAVLLLVVGCAGTILESSNKKEQGSSPQATPSEEARCEGTRKTNVNLPGLRTTNDLPGCPKGGLLLGTNKGDLLAGEKGDDEVRGLGGSDDIMGEMATTSSTAVRKETAWAAMMAMTSSTAGRVTMGIWWALAATTSSTAGRATIQSWT
jgi:hypothetical protein